MGGNLGRLLNCRHHCASDLPRRGDGAAQQQHYCEQLELVLNVLLAWPAICFPRDDGLRAGVDVLHRDLLLALTAVTVEYFEKRHVGA
jgi:hypothetical protein